MENALKSMGIHRKYIKIIRNTWKIFSTGDRLVVNLARMRGDYFITPLRPSGYRKVKYYTLIIRTYWLDKMKNAQTENVTNYGP